MAHEAALRPIQPPIATCDNCYRFDIAWHGAGNPSRSNSSRRKRRTVNPPTGLVYHQMKLIAFGNSMDYAFPVLGSFNSCRSLRILATGKFLKLLYRIWMPVFKRSLASSADHILPDPPVVFLASTLLFCFRNKHQARNNLTRAD